MLNEISYSEEEGGLVAGRVSTGLMQATPGEMKSLRSSAERIADIVEDVSGRKRRRTRRRGIEDCDPLFCRI